MFDSDQDQAAGLRRLAGRPGLHLLAFPVDSAAGQEGGIARLVQALHRAGPRPVVLDATRGLLALALGLRLKHELLDLLDGGLDFDTVAQATPAGVYVVRADRGVEAFVASGAPAQRLLSGFSRLSHGFGALVLAMPTAELACLASPLASVPVLVMDGSSQGLVQAYGRIKQLASRYGYQRFAAVLGGLGDTARAHLAHERMAAAASFYLGVEVGLAGCLPSLDPTGAALTEIARNLLGMAATPLNPSPALA